MALTGIVGAGGSIRASASSPPRPIITGAKAGGSMIRHLL